MDGEHASTIERNPPSSHKFELNFRNFKQHFDRKSLHKKIKIKKFTHKLIQRKFNNNKKQFLQLNVNITSTTAEIKPIMLNYSKNSQKINAAKKIHAQTQQQQKSENKAKQER